MPRSVSSGCQFLLWVLFGEERSVEWYKISVPKDQYLMGIVTGDRDEEDGGLPCSSSP